MNFVFNSIIQLFFFIFFSLSILGFGFFFKKNFLKINLSFGEIGLLGFFILYVISITLNFFVPIKIYLSFTLLITGFVIFFFNLRLANSSNNKLIGLLNKKFVILVFILFYISSLTINLHDDHLLYQLPYIKYKQEYKIIFGLVSLNDFLAYNHGFYDTMALFKVPFYDNRLVFLIPVIFFLFCILSIIENIDTKQNIIFNFIIFIIFLTLFKFTRTKEFGTDMPVIGLLFLIQIYFLKYFFTKKIDYFYKMLVFFSLAVIYKIYAVLSIFYFLIFAKKIKNFIFQFITKKKILFIFLIFTALATFSKNVIQSGCFNYPATFTCLEKNVISWSAGKELSQWRKEFLEASTKGWMAYIRDNEYSKKISPKQYNMEFKYNFHQNVIKDPDSERILIVLSILFATIVLNYFSKKKNPIFERPRGLKIIVLISLIPLVLWFILMPYIRYGGYAYLPFGFLILFYYFFYRYYNFTNILKFFLVFGIVYFFSKNILRINYELANIEKFSINYHETKKSFPIPYYDKIEVEEKKYDKMKLYISNHNWLCGISFLPCIPGFWENMKVDIKSKHGYIFISINEGDYVDILDNKMKVYYLSIDRYENDHNKKIRPTN